ncbi:elicitor-responsive protein 3 isoform X2 [Actinidia eriantha]|uniref:elicitor-responsive protein 3 isoform X2 n=1 Tax=Actinidia eriantha TaxID=165200 RepID=UPI0025888A18|nr:elicitor-responsive protein 3 isoform X2 [Actinidia eriantha]
MLRSFPYKFNLYPVLMKDGILEVLLVSAKGIQHTNVIGRPAYYVVIECGMEVQRSKISSSNHREICWNEKFVFEFPSSKWEKLTHLKLKIMDEEYFSDDEFVGETTIYLPGIIMEGYNKGFLEIRPTPYNVVLKDDTYKGEIKIGLKFIPNKEAYTADRRIFVKEERESGQSICRTIMNFCRVQWERWLLLYKPEGYEDKQKQV